MIKLDSTFKCPPGFKLLVPVPLKEEGTFCSLCKEHYKFAVSNQKDGSFVCYMCSTDYYC